MNCRLLCTTAFAAMLVVLDSRSQDVWAGVEQSLPLSVISTYDALDLFLGRRGLETHPDANGAIMVYMQVPKDLAKDLSWSATEPRLIARYGGPAARVVSSILSPDATASGSAMRDLLFKEMDKTEFFLGEKSVAQAELLKRLGQAFEIANGKALSLVAQYGKELQQDGKTLGLPWISQGGVLLKWSGRFAALGARTFYRQDRDAIEQLLEAVLSRAETMPSNVGAKAAGLSMEKRIAAAQDTLTTRLRQLELQPIASFEERASARQIQPRTKRPAPDKRNAATQVTDLLEPLAKLISQRTGAEVQRVIEQLEARAAKTAQQQEDKAKEQALEQLATTQTFDALENLGYLVVWMGSNSRENHESVQAFQKWTVFQRELVTRAQDFPACLEAGGTTAALGCFNMIIGAASAFMTLANWAATANHPQFAQVVFDEIRQLRKDLFQLAQWLGAQFRGLSDQVANLTTLAIARFDDIDLALSRFEKMSEERQRQILHDLRTLSNQAEKQRLGQRRAQVVTLRNAVLSSAARHLTSTSGLTRQEKVDRALLCFGPDACGPADVAMATEDVIERVQALDHNWVSLGFGGRANAPITHAYLRPYFLELVFETALKPKGQDLRRPFPNLSWWHFFALDAQLDSDKEAIELSRKLLTAPQYHVNKLQALTTRESLEKISTLLTGRYSAAYKALGDLVSETATSAHLLPEGSPLAALPSFPRTEEFVETQVNPGTPTSPGVKVRHAIVPRLSDQAFSPLRDLFALARSFDLSFPMQLGSGNLSQTRTILECPRLFELLAKSNAANNAVRRALVRRMGKETKESFQLVYDEFWEEPEVRIQQVENVDHFFSIAENGVLDYRFAKENEGNPLGTFVNAVGLTSPNRSHIVRFEIHAIPRVIFYLFDRDAAIFNGEPALIPIAQSTTRERVLARSERFLMMFRRHPADGPGKNEHFIMQALETRMTPNRGNTAGQLSGGRLLWWDNPPGSGQYWKVGGSPFPPQGSGPQINSTPVAFHFPLSTGFAGGLYWNQELTYFPATGPIGSDVSHIQTGDSAGLGGLLHRYHTLHSRRPQDCVVRRPAEEVMGSASKPSTLDAASLGFFDDDVEGQAYFLRRRAAWDAHHGNAVAFALMQNVLGGTAMYQLAFEKSNAPVPIGAGTVSVQDCVAKEAVKTLAARTAAQKALDHHGAMAEVLLYSVLQNQAALFYDGVLGPDADANGRALSLFLRQPEPLDTARATQATRELNELPLEFGVRVFDRLDALFAAKEVLKGYVEAAYPGDVVLKFLVEGLPGPEVFLSKEMTLAELFPMKVPVEKPRYKRIEHYIQTIKTMLAARPPDRSWVDTMIVEASR